MNVSLTPELEKLVNDKVKSGRYNSASEVIREGLRLLQDHDELKRIRLDELRREIMLGVEQIKNGQYTLVETEQELVEFGERIFSKAKARASKVKEQV
ncbi:MAG: type II toxin-antitoxin system ParD family antitoxin [Acidobacteria bacterium]|nr:type II toxin-antitoxin system ParD family antitoxin [Acidobacteriota bacterium]